MMRPPPPPPPPMLPPARRLQMNNSGIGGTMSSGRVSRFSTRRNLSVDTGRIRAAPAKRRARRRRLLTIDMGRFLFLPILSLRFVLLASVCGATSGSATAGNEKVIQTAGANQQGERAWPQVAERPATAASGSENSRSQQRRQQQQQQQAVETSEFDYEAELSGTELDDGDELDEQEQGQDESPELSPHSKLYMTVMRLIESERKGQLDEEAHSAGGVQDLKLAGPGSETTMQPSEAAAGERAPETPILDPDGRGQQKVPLNISLPETSNSPSTTSKAATAKGSSHLASVANSGAQVADGLESNIDQFDAGNRAANSQGSSPRLAAAGAHLQPERGHTNPPSRPSASSQDAASRGRGAGGQCRVQDLVVDKNRQRLVLFEWTCGRLKRIDRNVTAELNPKPDTLRLMWAEFETLPADALQPCRETLRDLLRTIERNAFANLTKLRLVYIFHAPRLVSFDFVITGRHPDLTHIRIQHSGLRTWPDLSEFEQERILTSIDLDYNRIESLGSRALNIRAEVVNLEFNQISRIDEQTFNGSEIGSLSLSGNRQLSSIHPNAFADLKNLNKLYLSDTSLTQLPGAGLQQLRLLKVEDNYALKRIPSIFVFPMLEEAKMTYSFHCCSFRYPKTHDPSAYEEHVRIQQKINAVCAGRQPNSNSTSSSSSSPSPAVLYGDGPAGSVPATSAGSATAAELVVPFDSSAPPLGATSARRSAQDEQEQDGGATGGVGGPLSQQVDLKGDFDEGVWQDGPRPVSPSPPLASLTTLRPVAATLAPPDGMHVECGELVLRDFQEIDCTPEPDAFNPCEDIMGYPVLRVAVWLVVACSMFGNLSVIVVLLGIYRRLSVPKFLQLNLAIGDLFMGVYLAMLAGADIATVGTYFNYALDWQHGLGCRLAGASSLFASQLSIFTLIVITFERYYTITYSIDLNMRLQLGWASRIMLIGWLYAFVSAMLPVFANINSYSKTSICLPMRTIYKSDRIFILVLLIVDSCAFLIIFICYLRMYLLIVRQKTEASLKERTVAMRMALLVFTDFACWAPIIFFSSTALFGKPLISVTNSKILIVFFYPLNSMANPFLYVLSTRQYRRDLNYVASRWRHWRKNLFKSDDKKDFSNNNYLIPYGPQNCGGGAGCGAGDKYANMLAMGNLNAVAAMTGVASHLHNHRIAISDESNDGHLSKRSQQQKQQRQQQQQVDLVGAHDDDQCQHDCSASVKHQHEPNDDLASSRSNGLQLECSHRHKHKHKYRCYHYHHEQVNKHVNKTVVMDAKVRPVVVDRPHSNHYIIRHQILPAATGRSADRSLSKRAACLSNEVDKVKIGLERGAQLHSQKKAVQLALTTEAAAASDSNERSNGRAGGVEGGGQTRSPRDMSATGCSASVTKEMKLVRLQPNQDGSKVEKPKMSDNSREGLPGRRLCSCHRRDNILNAGPGRAAGKSGRPNWSAHLNIRNKSRLQQRDSTSKSATQSTMITDVNSPPDSSINTCDGGGGRSSNEPDPETTATLETTTSTNTGTTTTSTTATTANSCDPEPAHDSPTTGGCKSPHGRHHHHRHQHRRHHRHHHHHHHHHHHDHHHSRRHRDARSRSQSCCGPERCEHESGAKLERITESSNTERSSTPRLDQNHCDVRHRRHHHHHHRHHHHHGHRHQHKCRSASHLKSPTSDDQQQKENMGQDSGRSRATSPCTTRLEGTDQGEGACRLGCKGGATDLRGCKSTGDVIQSTGGQISRQMDVAAVRPNSVMALGNPR